MKKYLIGFIFGAIIFTSIGVLALNITSSNVSYNDITVKEAIDDLYEKVDSGILKKFELSLRTESWSSTDAGITNYNIESSSIPSNYGYFKVKSLNSNNIKSYELKAYNKTTNTNINLELNKEYSLEDITVIWVVVYSKTTGSVGYVIPSIEFYNK